MSDGLIEDLFTDPGNRDTWTKSDLNRMIKSNTKLVDENRRLKKDLTDIVRYINDKSYLSKEDQILIEGTIEYYIKKFGLGGANDIV